MPGAIIYFILIISEQEEGRPGLTRYTCIVSAAKERNVNGTPPYSFGFRTSPTRKRIVMHVISRDAASGCDSRRKPPSWKTCMWIDRFLYAIVAIVMPVALHKSLRHRSSFHRPTSSSHYYFPITFINCFIYVRPRARTCVILTLNSVPL